MSGRSARRGNTGLSKRRGAGEHKADQRTHTKGRAMGDP